jgi:uncharacterized membrane protein
MPQFDFFVFPIIVFFSLVMFFFLYIFITKSLIPSLSRSTKMRTKLLNFSKKHPNVTKKDVYNETFKQFF